MGKKASRKTRWRTLDIADEQSDSEESNTTTAPRLSKAYQQKSQYNKVPYSSQSTPRRRYQHDGTKSTRSSSTASENKITFNEDEYTRITTPRQDVLFKKGYLNKPRSYQTQTSTGTSTTGNSTGNGTPDHQSTDLEYESQFVFPNGFVDQNGIYYVNSFEPYPLMLYNPPTYYPEFSNCKSKRYSTGSLTESTSPNNEEATSQDLSGGEASNNVSDYSSHRSVHNMVYSDYYANGICPPQEMVDEHCPTDQIRKIKKRRRRKTSRSLTAAQDSTECSDEETDSCTEEVIHPAEITPTEINSITSTETTNPSTSTDPPITKATSTEENTVNGCAEETTESLEDSKAGCETPLEHVSSAVIAPDERAAPEVHSQKPEEPLEHHKPLKYDLKPDAEEFIPRAYRAPEIPVQFIKVPPNFVHIPVVPFNGQNFNPAFIPSGIPIHFLPPDPKMYPNFIGFAPNAPEMEEKGEFIMETTSAGQEVQEHCDNPVTARDEAPTCNGVPETQHSTKKTIDIATVVSKLEEAAKEREELEVQSPKRNHFVKEYRSSPKYKNNYKRSFYNSPRNSPQRQVYQNGTTQDQTAEQTAPEQVDTKNIPDGSLGNDVLAENKFARNSPEKFRKNWKPNYQSRWQQNGAQKSPEFKPRQNYKVYTETKPNSRNYSDTLRNTVPVNPKLVEISTGDIVPETKKVESLRMEEAKTPKTSPKTSVPPLPTSNQWISVSSKKKRKNKNTEEADSSFADQEETTVDDDFEVYDINLLVDVVPSATATEEIIKVEITEGKVEDIISTIAESMISPVEINSLVPNIRSVAEIESELIAKEPEQLEQKEELIQPESEPSEVAKETTEEFIAVAKPKTKKKSKKGSQKTVTKRVIITDIDLSDKCEEIKTPVKKIVKKIEHHEETPEVAPNPVEPIEEVTKDPTLPQDNDEDEKKKSKKKRKKPSKSVTSDNSLPGSTATLTTGESYDFLLDASLADEKDKTNDEISQELDKIIQKGMYSNLEEKMRSLDIDESEGFFKSIFSKISTRDSYDKAGYSKTPDFTKITLFKPATSRQEKMGFF
ncbi:unnamed protein product [Phaedon cochleariae]|uniref:Uncharacterized protein n=1 Tax=Phaedon cochleariae TaxID=80249 RepID=A0A9N9X104_PHACE|nr:unnamed protein product [Phaedon cochleariae]